MANLAIKGHSTRGREVIQLLEMLGGKNVSPFLKGDALHQFYHIRESNNEIICFTYSTYKDGYKVFTLEEFLEKFPYKVGDKVVYKIYGIHSKIKSMLWNVEKEQIFYRLESNKLFVATADELKPLKEETIKENMEENKPPKTQAEVDKYLQKHPIKNAMNVIDIENCLETDGLKLPENVVINSNGIGSIQFIQWYEKPQYPKTFIEVLNFWYPDRQIEDDYQRYYKKDLIEKFQELLIARDAYWKIAGEQMGLGKDWKPDWSNGLNKCCLLNCENRIIRSAIVSTNTILAFPTEEMRDAFYENFKDLIDQCKELL